MQSISCNFWIDGTYSGAVREDQGLRSVAARKCAATNLQVLNAILYVAEQGCKWRGLPARFGTWHTIYVRMNRWAKSGCWIRCFEKLQSEQLVRIQIESFRAGLHFGEGASGWHGGVKKNGPQALGKSRGGWTTKIHLVAANARTAITFALSPGNAHDAPEGRELLRDLGPMPDGLPLLMDRAYEGNETRQLVLELGMTPRFGPLSVGTQLLLGYDQHAG